MSLAQRAARGAAVTMVFQVMRMGIVFASTVLLARLLDPADFGLVAMVAALVALAELFRDFGLSTAALRAKSLTHGQQSNLFWVNTLAGVLMAVVVFFLAEPVAAFYGEPEVANIVRVVAATFVLSGMTVQFKVAINRDLRFTALGITELVPHAVGFAVALVLALVRGDYWALVAYPVTMAVLGLVLSAALARWRPGMPRRGESIADLMKFGANFMGSQLLTYLMRNIDTIAIGRVYGATSLGFYDRAYQFVVVPTRQVFAPATKVALPVLSRFGEDDARLTRALLRAQTVTAYAGVVVYGLMVALGPAVVAVLFGPDWELTGQIARILAIGGLFRVLGQIAYWVFLVKGLAGSLFRYNILGNLIVVAAILGGLPWGVKGVAVGYAVGCILNWATQLWWVQRAAQLSMRSLLNNAAAIVGLFGVPMGVLAWGASQLADAAWAQLVWGIAAAAAWSFVAWLVFPPVRRHAAVIANAGRLAIKRPVASS